MSGLPDGWVDPIDPAEVAAVLTGTAAAGGLSAVADLLARLPGTRSVPAVPRGFLRAAVPGAVWLGEEWCWSATEPPVLLHVVGGVVLHRAPLTVHAVGELMARPVVELNAGAVADASAVLTAARDLAAG